MELQKLFVTLALKGQEFRQGMEGALSTAQDFGQRVSGMFDRLKSMAKLAMLGVGTAVVAGFTMAIKSSIDVNAQLETTTLQFETLMGDADLAKKHVEGLFDFAEKTPFETEPIIQASLKLQTFGGEALNSMENLTLLGDAAAATNAPIDELGFWVGRLYSNLESGQPFGEAAMRLQELAVMSPQARMEMERLQESGASAAEIFAYFQEDLTRFTGAMEQQASTWQGMWSTLKDQVSLVLADALVPFFETGKEGMAELIALLNDPDIIAGIKAMGAELGKVADLLAEITGSTVRFFAALGQESANLNIVEELNIPLEEYRELLYEIQQEQGVGFFMTTEEELAVHTAVNEALRERYLLEIAAIGTAESRAAAEEEIKEGLTGSTQATNDSTLAIQGSTAALFAWRSEAVMLSERTKLIPGETESAKGGISNLTLAVAENAAAFYAAEDAALRYAAAFAAVVTDYSTPLAGADQPLVTPPSLVSTITGGLDAQGLELLDQYQAKITGLEREIFNLESGLGAYGMTQEEVSAKVAEARGEIEYYSALMAPLTAQTGELSTAQVGLTVNVGGVKQAIFDQLVQIGAAPEVIALYGVAIGVMTEQQAIAALSAAAVQIKVEELAQAIADGMPVDQALTDLDSFVTKIQDEMTPAAEQASIDIPEYITTMKELVGKESLAAGQALGEGLTQGIEETRDGALAMAGDTALAVISETKLAYGIESPSTVFAGIGGDLMAGLSQGLEDQREAIISKATSIGGSVIDGLTAGIEAGKAGLRDVLRGVADVIPDWLAQFLGIRSPARATIPIGQAIVQGITAGIEEEFSLAENTLYMLSANLVSYFQEVIDGGDAMNQWLEQIPEDMRPNILLISDLIGEGNEYVAEYFNSVTTEGDYLNDWLQDFPEELQEFVSQVGEAIAEGLEQAGEYFEYIGSFQHTLDELSLNLEWAETAAGIASGFEKRFRAKITDPLEEEIAGLDQVIAQAASMYQEVMGGVYSMLEVHEWTGQPIFGWDPRLDPVDPMADWTDPAQFQTALEQLFELFRKLSKTGLREEAERVSEAIQALMQRNALNEEYVRQQEKILALENAKADLDYLKTQMELLQLFKDNSSLPPSLLEGVRFGLSADPEMMMALMVDVTERLVRSTQHEINQSLNQTPSTSSQETIRSIQNYHVQTQNINGGQHNYFGRETDSSYLEELGVQSR